MIYFNSKKKSPLLAFIKFEPTFLTGSLAVCLSAPIGYFVSTVGITEKIVQRYIEMQGKEDSGQAKLDLK